MIATDSLQGQIQTVLGRIDPAELGPTLMHEHLIWDIRPPVDRIDEEPLSIDLCNCWQINYGRPKVPGNLIQRSGEIAEKEVAFMVEAGGKSVVELSSGGLRPEPQTLAQISRATGAHIIMGCGHYVDEYQADANRGRTVDDFASEILGQVQQGAWDTEIRAGIIGEIGCQDPWTELEKRVMHGAIIAQRECGAALNVHPGRDSNQPLEIAAFVSEHGGDPSRTILSHIDRTIFDVESLLRLADTGCVIEFDLFGQNNSYYPLNTKINMPNDAIRLEKIRALIDRGHLEQIVISHDICYLTRLRSYGGHGYGHIFTNVVPLMKNRDFTEEEIGAILVENPQRLLTFV